MAIIKLQDYYPSCEQAQYLEVSDELALQLLQWERDEKAYLRRRNRHRAYYSLNRADGIEHCMLFVSMSPDDHYERLLTLRQLYDAISMLPDKQAQRIIACYIRGLSQSSIAKAEGVSRNVVSKSIRRGLKALGEILKNLK